MRCLNCSQTVDGKSFLSSNEEVVQEMGDFDDPGHVVVDVVVAMLLLPVFAGESEKKQQQNDVLRAKSG